MPTDDEILDMTASKSAGLLALLAASYIYKHPDEVREVFSDELLGHLINLAEGVMESAGLMIEKEDKDEGVATD